MSAKRRAAQAASPELSTPSNNKRRRTNGGDNEETPEGTTEVGLKLLQILKKCKDSQGREVATEFLHLPDKKLIPEYYEQIKLPLALDTIERKLNRHEYPTLEALEGDVKRLIQNARDFNERGSQITEDAERLRKAMANFMPKYNPRYSDPTYKAVPTPIPDGPSKDEPQEEPPTEKRRSSLKIKLTNKRAVTGSPAVATPKLKLGKSAPAPAPTPAPPPVSTLDSFEGVTFQQAQEMIMDELINLKDDEGNDIAVNFLERPDKKRYADYYRKISKPVALLILQKRARGVVHNRVTGTSLYNSWDAFADDVRLLWKNARAYNEEGSEIYELAGKLEEYFEPRLAEARKHVKDPAAMNANGLPKLKLTMNNASETPEPAQKKLILTHNGPSKTPPVSTPPRVTTETDAAKRQQETVRPGSSGDVKARASEAPRREIVQATTNGTPASQVNGVDAEKTTGTPTTPTGAATTKGPSIPPPGAPSQGTPAPQAAPPPPPRPVHKPTSILDTRFRSSGKDITSALLSNVSMSTHPGIKVARRYHLDIPPSAKMTQHSHTVVLPQSHYYIRLGVKLSANAKERVAKKVVVSQNGFPRAALPGDADAPVYDFRLNPGMNVIWVDVIAGPLRTEAKPNNIGEATDFERVTIYAHLLRQ